MRGGSGLRREAQRAAFMKKPGKSVGKNEALRIRPGTARDVPAILELIRALAEYERLTLEFRAEAKRLRRDGFGARRYFETLMCTRGGRPVGFALYFFTYSTFMCRPTLYVEDLFVLPEERRKGAGKALVLGAVNLVAIAWRQMWKLGRTPGISGRAAHRPA